MYARIISSFSDLAIDLRSVNVETANQGDQVGDHKPFTELVDDAHGGIGPGADAHAVRILAAVADDIETHITARRFDSRVALSRRRFELARHFCNGRTLGQHL